jgi:hypothetical protein
LSERNSVTISPNNDFNIALIVISIFIVLILVCAGIFYFAIFRRVSPPKFCTSEDEIFQMIEAQKDKWIEQFRKSNGYPVLRFTTSDGHEHVVNADRWNMTSESPQFYVQVVEERNEPYGSYGYLYQATDILDHRYKITPMTDGIYCYQFR